MAREAKTHDNVSISIVNAHQATAKRHDLQRQVTLLLRARVDAALTQRRIMGGGFNAALSRYGYAQSTSALHDKVDKFFQDFLHSTHGALIESEAHTRCVFVVMTGWVCAGWRLRFCTRDSLASGRTLSYLLESGGENLGVLWEPLGSWATRTRRNTINKAFQYPISSLLRSSRRRPL